MGVEIWLPMLIRYAIIPEVTKLLRANPTMTDADIIAKLPADVLSLVTGDQTFLDAIRTQAGKA